MESDTDVSSSPDQSQTQEFRHPLIEVRHGSSVTLWSLHTGIPSNSDRSQTREFCHPLALDMGVPTLSYLDQTREFRHPLIGVRRATRVIFSRESDTGVPSSFDRSQTREFRHLLEHILPFSDWNQRREFHITLIGIRRVSYVILRLELDTRLPSHTG